ncbi:hypothetical protein [Acidithiobacillus sp.]|uniref:hypothetical protein n=1 Tax=Acidithiobacillus sp. TaxID=1872118 RepID=UPI003D00283A
MPKPLQQIVDQAWRNGMTYAAMGRVLGVSRQRVEQIRRGQISASGEAQVRHYRALLQLAEQTHDPRITGAL